MSLTLTFAICTALFMWSPIVIACISQILGQDYANDTIVEKRKTVLEFFAILLAMYILSCAYVMAINCEFSDGIVFNGNTCWWWQR
jgi:hypothetical protein